MVRLHYWSNCMYDSQPTHHRFFFVCYSSLFLLFLLAGWWMATWKKVGVKKQPTPSFFLLSPFTDRKGITSFEKKCFIVIYPPIWFNSLFFLIFYIQVVIFGSVQHNLLCYQKAKYICTTRSTKAQTVFFILKEISKIVKSNPV